MTTVVAWFLLGLGALISVGNWSLVVRRYVARKGSSMIPFIGGLLGFAGCALLPAIGWKLGLIALAVDPGGVGLALALPIDRVLRRGARD